MWYSSVLLVLLFPILLVFFRRRQHYNAHKKLNFPPGPKPWPLIGNLNLIGPLPHVSIRSLSEKYGPLMQLKFGEKTVVVGSSAEVAQLFLKTQDVTFASRPQVLAGKYLNYEYSALGGAPYGPYWRQARKIILMELFSARRIDQFEYIRVEERRAFFSNLYKLASSSDPTPAIHLKDRLYLLNLDTMSRMVFGKTYTQEDRERNNSVVSPKEFTEMLDEFFTLSGVLDIGDAIPWLAPLDLQGNVKRMKAVNKKLDRLYEHILEEHYDAARRDSVKENGPTDMVDVLVQLAEDPTGLEVKLERHQVKAIIQDLLLAGSDTSAVNVEWVMAELLKHPQVMQKATQELDQVIGRNRWVDEKDIVDLPYIQAIIKETMRLHPVATLLVPRVARENCKVAGYDILKDTRVFINVWTIGRDPTLWERPDEFWPERFIGKDIDVKGHNFELLPFGSGRRMCLGYGLGIKVIQASLANLLHGFEWSLDGDMEIQNLDMEERFGLTTCRKYPLAAIPKPRLPPHVYDFPLS